ncbi:hypothetical protein UFOVP826_62 [uncultured Caudovirales phage]|uniref:Uncharacterized protein n=1 Tax=uncultured Caudovirales phage TaxID=2100421 RepID=A0A6J5P0M2_9CAUD|nr:hypothetical protein UFOVP826_62 [uncultured Caudovirales phage]
MADNVGYTPGTGATVAADEIGGVLHQRIKLTLGADGVSDGDVSSSNPLPVSVGGVVDISGTITDGAASTGQMLLVGGQTGAGVAQVFETNGSGHLNISDGGGSITVDGPLTDGQLRASPVPVSGSITADTGLSQPLTDTQLRAAAVPVSADALPLPTGAATETTLSALNAKFITSANMPDQNSVALPVRNTPQKYWDASFPQVGSGLLSPRFTQIGATGTGMAVNQSAGNLVITTGTTANAEVTLRSAQSFTGALTLHQLTTLSQRIVNNNFFVELVDVIGDALTYNIVNATTVDVTRVAHGFTAQSVGQRMDIGCITGAAGIPMEAVIASIPSVDVIRFTVAGWPASGTGTCSLTGWNKIELVYTGTTATAVNFNTRRQGWQNTAVAATISTTASGHITATNVCNGVVSLADQVNTSAGVYANRNAWRSNIPEPEVAMFLQLRARNGTTNPASTTTWTIGFARVEDYIPTQVDIVGTKQQSSASTLPVSGAVTVSGTATVSGTVTATVTAGTVNPVVPATPYILNSAASTNEALILTGTSGLQAFYATNTGATVAFVKLYNKATAPISSDIPAMILSVPAAVSGVPGVCTLPIGFSGFRFALGLGIRITGAVADNDTTAVAAGQVKVMLSRTI